MTSMPQQSQLVSHGAWTSVSTQQNVPDSWPGQLFWLLAVWQRRLPTHWESFVHGCLRSIVSVSMFLHFCLHFFRAALLCFLLHFFWQDLASACSPPSNEVSPSPARVPATADLKRPRREPSALIPRTSRSNVELSIAFPPCTVVAALR